MAQRHKLSGLRCAGLALVLIASAVSRAPLFEPPYEARPVIRTVEIRAYNLKPGTRPEFHRLVTEQAVPLLRRGNIDVVAFGPSAHDDTSYFLVRAYASLADRQRSEDAFYGSDEWRKGPRTAILACIESYTTVVLPLDGPTLRGLRASPATASQK